MKKEPKKRIRRFGRPPGNPKDVRSKRVATFVTEGELTKLEQISEHEKISLSAVVYRMISKSL